MNIFGRVKERVGEFSRRGLAAQRLIPVLSLALLFAGGPQRSFAYQDAQAPPPQNAPQAADQQTPAPDRLPSRCSSW
jgi:hypothetical protein